MKTNDPLRLLNYFSIANYIQGFSALACSSFSLLLLGYTHIARFENFWESKLFYIILLMTSFVFLFAVKINRKLSLYWSVAIGAINGFLTPFILCIMIFTSKIWNLPMHTPVGVLVLVLISGVVAAGLTAVIYIYLRQMTTVIKNTIYIYVLVITLTPTAKAVNGGEGAIIYGENFSFSLAIPKGWICDCEGSPQLIRLQANAALWKKGETFDNAQPFIYLRVNPRGQGAKDDLDLDILETKKRLSNMTFEALPIKNSRGEVAAKIFQLKKIKTEYVVYFYPKDAKSSLSLTMHLDKRDANNTELKIFREIVSSINWITDQVTKGSKTK